MTQRYGATPEEWAAWADGLGLLADLLPVVSNPNATLSPHSSIREVGKTPSTYNSEGNVSGFPRWADYVATAADIAEWSAQPDYGICVNTRTVHAFDVDLDNQETAGRVWAILQAFGAMTRVRANSTRFLVVFRPETPFKPRKPILFGEDGKVEFYAIGKQFVACGTHPSGSRYQFVNPGSTPPVLSVSQVEALWSAMQALAPEAVKQPVDEAAPTEVLVEAIISGDSLHEALRGLAWRGWSAGSLERLMDRSAARADDPKRWADRRADIPRYVESAGAKRSDEAGKAFGVAAQLPPGATPPDPPKPFDPSYNDPGKAWDARREGVTVSPLLTTRPDPVAPADGVKFDAQTAGTGDNAPHVAQKPDTAAPEAGDRDEARRAQQLEEARRVGEGETEEELAELLKPTVLSLEEMLRDLVYVEGSGAVVHLPTMRVRKKDTAAATFKASKERWIDGNGNVQERAAFPLWIESPGRMSVDVITWTPRYGPICRPPESGEAGDRAVNLWRGWNAWPEPGSLQAGDVGAFERTLEPFFEHLGYLVPDDAERWRFLQWLGHIAQRPGELPHTCYLMITETTGIGRNWLTCLLASVFRGYVAAGVALSGILDGSFNGRLSRKVLATVDEAQEGLTGQRFQKANTLKRIITEEWREINPKYGVPTVEYNCCRWLMLSNHRDALPIDNSDRRVIVIDNPTKRQSTDYYNRIYGVVRRPDFIASVFHYLLRVDLTGFVAQAPAPMNAAKASVLDFMETDVARALRSFKAEWPGDMVDYKTLSGYVADHADGDMPNRFHLKRAMQEAGMVTTSRRIMVNGFRSFIVLLNDMDRATFDELSNSDVVDRINAARAKSAFN